MKAVFLDYGTMGDGLDVQPLRNAVGELRIYDNTDDAQVAERILGADAVLTNKIRLTPQLLNSAPSLRFIGLTATGTDNVDLDAARQHNIAVANIRGYCTQSVAEHVFGVLLTLTHSLRAFSKSVRDGEWQKSDDAFLLTHPVRELSAMTLGIVGYGVLGQGVAKIARAFGMNVLVSVRPGTTAVPKDRVSFDDLLLQSDVISLHCPLNESTRCLFGAEQFSHMRDSAIIVNTARGGLIDSQALADALSGGDIAAAAVDVLPQEPPIDGNPLLDYAGDNLIITPHIAWATNEARQNAIDELAANINAFIAGETRNRVV